MIESVPKDGVNVLTKEVADSCLALTIRTLTSFSAPLSFSLCNNDTSPGEQREAVPRH